MLKAIFFDMDGVLINSKEAWFRVFTSALKELEGKTMSTEEFNRNVWAKEFHEIRPQYFSSKERVQQYFSDAQQTFLSLITSFDGVKEVLLQLAEKFPLYVVTNTYTERAKEMLEQVELLSLPKAVFGADLVKRAKPEPDLLLYALSKAGVEKKEVVFIGDTVWDRMAAKKAGVDFIGFQVDAKKRIEKLDELLYLLESA